MWPFQQGVAPAVGDVFKGKVLTAELLAEVDPADWPTELFSPTPGQMVAGLAIAALGLGVTMLIGRLGSSSGLQRKHRNVEEG